MEQLIFILFILAISGLQVVFRKLAEKGDPGHGPTAPGAGRDASPTPEKEAMRRLFEALGLPTDTVEGAPPPAASRGDRFPSPASAMPELERVEAPPPPPPVSLPDSERMAEQQSETGTGEWWSDNQETVESALAVEAVAPRLPISPPALTATGYGISHLERKSGLESRAQVLGLLRSRERAREAFVLREILDEPPGLRVRIGPRGLYHSIPRG